MIAADDQSAAGAFMDAVLQGFRDQVPHLEQI
jgi:hypothetical protein